MPESEFMGLLVGGLVVLIGLIITIITPIIKLNTNIVKLNSSFGYMEERDRIRDERIDKHGKEIDEIVNKQKDNEKLLSNHDWRIKNLEEHAKNRG